MPSAFTHESCCSNRKPLSPTSAPLNSKNIRIASRADKPVASSATPRITTRKLCGTNVSARAASSGRQKIAVSIGSVGFQREVQHQRHSQCEQEGIGLQI